MAATFADLKNEVYGHVYGYARDQEQVTYLTAGIDSDDVTISVADVTQLSRGIAEIDDELVWVLSKNVTGNTATIAPSWGRGYLGSTAASHSTNAKVTGNPRFTRLQVSNMINETILGVYPALFGVGQTTFTWNGSITTYALSSAADRVLNAEWELPGPSNEWATVRRWRELLSGDGGVNEITIYDGVVPGRTVRVNYAKKPTALAADGDTLTGTGLAESARDVVVFGTVAKLIMLSESGRLQSRAIESSELTEDVPAGSSTTIGKRFYDLYQSRLAEERNRLLQRFPPAVHLTR
jgi:hypothetical protein